HTRRDQVLTVRRIDAVIAGMSCRRARYTHMHLARSRVADHLHDLTRCRAADDRIIYEDDAAAFDQIFYRIKFEPDAKGAYRLRRFDEGTSDVVVSDDRLPIIDAGLCRISDRRRNARIGHRHDDVRLDRMFERELLAHLMPRFVHRLAEDDRIRPREIDVFERANGVLLRFEREALRHAFLRNNKHLARSDLA